MERKRTERKKIKADSADSIKQHVTYPDFKTLDEQKAFQLGMCIAFNAIADTFRGTSRVVLDRGEEILKIKGWKGLPTEDDLK